MWVCNSRGETQELKDEWKVRACLLVGGKKNSEGSQL